MLKQYAGVWYEYSKYMQGAELLQDCITATYTTNPDGSMNVFNKGRLPVWVSDCFVWLVYRTRPHFLRNTDWGAITFRWMGQLVRQRHPLTAS